MVLGKVSDFLIKHQRLLTYLSIFAALMLLMRLVYDDVLIDHDNPIVLAIFIGILVLWTLALTLIEDSICYPTLSYRVRNLLTSML